jgi:hypothetical protein
MSTQERAEGLLKECLKDARQAPLKQVQDALMTLEPSIEAYIVSERNDYLRWKQWVVKLDQGDPEAWLYNGDPSKRFLQFRLNRTLHVQVDNLKRTFRGLESGWLSGLRAIDRISRQAWEQRFEGWRQFVSMNGLGNYLVGEMWSRSAGDFGNHIVGRVALHRMTIMTLALRR